MAGWTPILVAGGGALALGIAGGATTIIGEWYRALRKPSWQPPNWAFGPAWSIILACAATAAVLGWNAAGDAAARSDVIIVFAVNAVAFLAWSPLFFMARRPDWSLVEWVFLWASVLAIVVALWPISTTAALFALPYLAWVSFAGWLNLAIVRLNAPF